MALWVPFPVCTPPGWMSKPILRYCSMPRCRSGTQIMTWSMRVNMFAPDYVSGEASQIERPRWIVSGEASQVKRPCDALSETSYLRRRIWDVVSATQHLGRFIWDAVPGTPYLRRTFTR